MNRLETDIWFGPGGLHGIFGAGVARGLQEAFRGGEISASEVRLFGSSVGCLTAAYLATDHADYGTAIFRDDIDGLITPSNLLPSLRLRLANQIRGVVSRSPRAWQVPSVLDIDHALAVMMRRTPAIVQELARAKMPVFAEIVHARSRDFQHIDLRSAQDSLSAIRSSLNCFPFAWSRQTQLLDSGIAGYGFCAIQRRPASKLVVVLNTSDESPVQEWMAGAACAALSANLQVARLYLGRQGCRKASLRAARHDGGRTLVISPPGPIRLKERRDFQRAHRRGQEAARQIVDFIQRRG
jgi:predicted acylesterase/phospholipase RssA